MQNSSHILPDDTQAIFLLCGQFSKRSKRSVKPLSLDEYNLLAAWLRSQGLRPQHLLGPQGQEQLKTFEETKKVTRRRVAALLNRGAAMAMAVEDWTNLGGWIIARSDDTYPRRLIKRLRHQAPPILYGVGKKELLERGGLSIVGSRDADDAAFSFVRDLAGRCAEQGLQVVSGGAPGVGRQAIAAALKAGGTVTGALAKGLAKAATSQKYRKALLEGRLVLISAFRPKADAQSWAATMARNKHVYALGDGTLVVHSSKESGGTWAGAAENLTHEWVPLFVRAETPIPDGNQALIEKGGVPVDRGLLAETTDLRQWLQQSKQNPSSQKPSAEEQLPELFAQIAEEDPPDLYHLVWPVLAARLDTPKSAEELHKQFANLRFEQLRDWLETAVQRGDALRKEEPKRYHLRPDDKAPNTTDPPASGNGHQTFLL